MYKKLIVAILAMFMIMVPMTSANAASYYGWTTVWRMHWYPHLTASVRIFYRVYPDGHREIDRVRYGLDSRGSACRAGGIGVVDSVGISVNIPTGHKGNYDWHPFGQLLRCRDNRVNMITHNYDSILGKTYGQNPNPHAVGRQHLYINQGRDKSAGPVSMPIHV
jgi:hypothetical protein